MIDHLKVHYGSPDCLFGTTRTHERPNTLEHQIYTIIVKLDSDHKVCDSCVDTIAMARLDSINSVFSNGSFVTGIGHSISATGYFDMIIFDPTLKKLWYIGQTNLNAKLIYTDIDFVTETVFAGTNEEGGVKQSYSAGYAI